MLEGRRHQLFGGIYITMDLAFDLGRATAFKGPTQRIRALTEHWFARQGYCPSCGHSDMRQHPANRPVADFYCSVCAEEFELKSLGRPLGPKVGDGAFRTMIQRLESETNPSLFLLHYDPIKLSVLNLLVVPRYFFVPGVIQARKPLAATARRAGWIGCNIMMAGIPLAGRIPVVTGSIALPRGEVLARWDETRFLQGKRGLEAKGWLLSVMRCIERLNAEVFTLEQVYDFEKDLQRQYPANAHVRPKIRQQLQVLRDAGFLQFTGKGRYRLSQRR